jgi:hypothetical protein
LPPHSSNIRQKIPDQLLRGRELIRLFDSLVMPVIALPWFVVVADQAYPGAAVKQAVLERVSGAPNRVRNLPSGELRDRTVVIMAFTVKNAPRSLHMT